MSGKFLHGRPRPPPAPAKNSCDTRWCAICLLRRTFLFRIWLRLASCRCERKPPKRRTVLTLSRALIHGLTAWWRRRRSSSSCNQRETGTGFTTAAFRRLSSSGITSRTFITRDAPLPRVRTTHHARPLHGPCLVPRAFSRFTPGFSLCESWMKRATNSIRRQLDYLNYSLMCLQAGLICFTRCVYFV